MMDQDTIIEVQSVTKTYKLYERNSDRLREVFSPGKKKYHRSFDALKDISFSVKRGQSIGIIGRNGSGKSTLLQILCNIIQPTSGTVTVGGRVSALLELGAGFNPEFTGRENVYMYSAILGLSREDVDQRIDKIAAFAEIGSFLDQPVKMYSSGMYVRLAFATAISVEPEILVVDEALAVGDIFFQQKCISHMKEVMANCTIVFVTHDMHTVTNLCERVIVLDNGVKIYEGNPLDGVARYTKLIHSEGTGRRLKVPAQGPPASDADDPSKEAVGNSLPMDQEAWTVVPEEAKGGVNEIDIVKVRLLDENKQAKTTVEPGDILLAQMIVKTSKETSEVIFGYTVKDRIGNAIFGENTCSSLVDTIALAPGRHLVEMKLVWPEIYPDTYTFTFGVGEGDDPFVHMIHCWAHNILSITALKKERGVHGIFNNPILACSVVDAAQ